MRLNQSIVFPLLTVNCRGMPTRLVYGLLHQMLKVFVLMAVSDNLAKTSMCQLQFIMVGLLIYKQQTSSQCHAELSKLKSLRRKHNSFWQHGAVLASQAQQKAVCFIAAPTIS